MIGVATTTFAMIAHVLYMMPTGWMMNVESPQTQYREFVARNSGGKGIYFLQGAFRGRGGANPVRGRRGSSMHGVKSNAAFQNTGMRGLMQLGVHEQGDRLETHKLRMLRFRLSDTELRYVEYTLTAPVLMLAVQSIVTLHAPIWTLQAAYLGIMLTNALGIPLHQSVSCMVRFSDMNNKKGPESAVLVEEASWMAANFMWCAVCLLLGSWCFFFASWISYMVSLSRYARVFFAQPELIPIFVLILCLPFFYSLFGIYASWVYVRFMRYYNEPQWDMDKLRGELNWLARRFDGFSAVIKILAVIVVTNSDQFGPRSACFGES